jgi:prepilin-type N-terminal cleavage/methylation domain-containing protein
MKKAFSLLEIIFVITVISLISSYVLHNSQSFLQKANLTQIKAQIALIRTALNVNKNQRIRQGLSEFPTSLDNAKINAEKELLFGGTQDEKLLDYPLIATTIAQKEVGSFAKIASNSYYVWLDKENFVEFVYKANEGTFSCSYTNVLCKELD